MNPNGRYFRNVSLAVLLSLVADPAAVAKETSIAILDFELNDLALNLTPNPVNAEEAERTASLKPLLQAALAARGGYRIVEVGSKNQDKAERGFGYLFDHHDVAAELGHDFGADWIIVGRVHKASFLFVYFKAHLISTETERLVGDYTVEVKGQQKQITPKGIERLAEQIDDTIRGHLAKQPDTSL